MLEIRISGTDIVTSRLGLGSASLHHLPTSKARQNLLEHAWFSGIRYYDTAPFYGHGLAEHEIGKFAKGRRGKLVLVTKFGIPPSSWLARFPSLSFPLLAGRALLSRLGLARAPRHDYSSVFMKNSVERSLRALRADYVDILMLHEPMLRQIPDPDDLAHELDLLKASGKIRYVGLSGYGHALAEIAVQFPKLGEVIQVEVAESSGGVGALQQCQRDVQVTFGHFRGAQMNTATTEERFQRLQEKLSHATQLNPSGVILFSTRKPSHIDEVVSSLEKIERHN